MPLNVAMADGWKIIQNSGIKDWEEEELPAEAAVQVTDGLFRVLGLPPEKKRDDRKLKNVERSISTSFRRRTTGS